MKPTRRKAFNFLRSYYDIYNELENDKQRIEFINAIFAKQFHNIDPDLKGIVKLAYAGAKHSIDESVKGYMHKTNDPMKDPSQGANEGAGQQEEEEEKGKGEEEEKGKEKQKGFIPILDLYYNVMWHTELSKIYNIGEQACRNHFTDFQDYYMKHSQDTRPYDTWKDLFFKWISRNYTPKCPNPMLR